MPDVNAFLNKKSSKRVSKTEEWDISTLVASPKAPVSPQRRPGRGEDSPTLPPPAQTQIPIQPLTIEKTAHKVNTNRAQSEHKVDTQPDTNRAQSGHIRNKPSGNFSETEHKPDTQPDTASDTNRTQTAHKVDTNLGFSSLVGIQRDVAVFIYRSCQYARAQETDALTLEHIASSLRIRIGSVKTTLRRLEQKGILHRVSFRNGRGGWSKYRLPETTFREMLHLETGHKLDTNRAQTAHKVDTQPDTQPDTSLSSSSSFLISENLKTTTTGEQELLDDGRVQLAPDWENIDFSPLSEFGFSRSHVIQLAKHGQLSAAEVQDSIHFFSFDLKRNGKGRELKGPPVNFFMGILRKGMPYAPPENYESLQQEARRKFLEAKRRLEEIHRAEEQEIQSIEFTTWRRGLTEEQVRSLVPEIIRDIRPAREAAVRLHFDSEVWPDIRVTIPGEITAEHTAIQRQIDESLGKEGIL